MGGRYEFVLATHIDNKGHITRNADYTEEFDGVTTSGGSAEPGPGDDSSDSAGSGESAGGSSGNSSSGKKGCGSVTAGFVSVAAVALLLAVFRKKKIN